MGRSCTLWINNQTSEHKTVVVAGGMNFAENQHASIDGVMKYDPQADKRNSADTKLPEPRPTSLCCRKSACLILAAASAEPRSVMNTGSSVKTPAQHFDSKCSNYSRESRRLSLLRDIDHFAGFELIRHSELLALAADLAFTHLISLERFAFDRYLTRGR